MVFKVGNVEELRVKVFVLGDEKAPDAMRVLHGLSFYFKTLVYLID